VNCKKILIEFLQELVAQHQEPRKGAEKIHVILEHPHTEYWLISIRNLNQNDHQTPIRDI
jgi:hypothetical protein